jgi:hypothetical protein
MGPQLLREHGSLKKLGIKLCPNRKEVVDLNYRDKVWILNSFVLSKLWYLAQVLPAENIHIGKMRKLLGKFLWRGSLYKN